MGLVAQAGIAAFVTWYGDPGDAARDHRGRLRHRPAGADPVDLAAADPRAAAHRRRRRRGPGRRARRARAPQQRLRESVLRYSREVAFAAAQIYARRRRGPRCVGRPAGGPGRRRPRARRGGRRAALPGRGAGLGRADEGRGRASGTTPPGLVEDVVDDLRRSRPPARRGRPGRRPGRPDRRRPRPRRATRSRSAAARWPRSSAPARWSTGPVDGRPGRGEPLRPGRARRPGRGPGLARRAAPGRRRRAAPRAAAHGRRHRPAGPGRPRLPASGRRGRRPAGDRRRLPGPGPVDRGRRPAPCSSTRTPCATGCGVWPRSPAGTRRPRGRVSCSRSPSPQVGWPSRPSRDDADPVDRLCRKPPTPAAARFVGRRHADTARSGQLLTTCSPSSAPVRAPRPPASSAVAGGTRRRRPARRGSPP